MRPITAPLPIHPLPRHTDRYAVPHTWDLPPEGAEALRSPSIVAFRGQIATYGLRSLWKGPIVPIQDQSGALMPVLRSQDIRQVPGLADAICAVNMATLSSLQAEPLLSLWSPFDRGFILSQGCIEVYFTPVGIGIWPVFGHENFAAFHTALTTIAQDPTDDGHAAYARARDRAPFPPHCAPFGAVFAGEGEASAHHTLAHHHPHTALRALWGRIVSARAGLPFSLRFVPPGQEATPA